MDASRATTDDQDIRIGEAAAPPGPLMRSYLARKAEPEAEREARWAAWRTENADAMVAYNEWYEREGYRYLRPPRI